MFDRNAIRGWLLVGFAAVVLGASGCGSKSPKIKTYPVTGSVVYRGAPLTGGSIHFHSLRDAAVTSAGDIKEDGTFSLHTLVDTNKLPGTTEGAYRVTIQPQLPADHKTVVRPFTLGQTFQVEAKENQFTIDVGASGRRR